MKRNFLFTCYRTARGELLRRLESDYLQRSITVSCKQTILQIGGLGWEKDFIDCSLYKNYIILDSHGVGSEEAKKIQAEPYRLPLQCDSVDMIILSHLLEFDANRLQTMREVERVLKPEGVLVILNFNPWNLWITYQYLWEIKKPDPCRWRLIRRSRLLDWLKLLNFEVTLSTEFNFNSVISTHGQYIAHRYSVTAVAYAIKAIKRRYNVIPLTPVREAKPRLVLVNSINSSTQLNYHD
ncbi:class I SAM-dependent methyltransferase [Methylosarcina fibrata]|uniref:class I SAM-dependent methyltransferase n=1 Tax=Methylosarcina fibrata TaxID=105972 RepID=UPI00037689C1|nr:methyltransferase domain-containing protein [Methylosarcina fibrata]